jgi:hypothetical protein
VARGHPWGCVATTLSAADSVTRMGKSATAHTAKKGTTPARRQGRSFSRRVEVAGLIVLVLALGAGLFVATGAGTRQAAGGAEHSVGSASAPVVLEEWSDFE